MTDPVLTARGCRWIAIPGVKDQRGSVNFIEMGKGLEFPIKRAFWLHHIAPGQWRGRHGHRESTLVITALAGGCRVHLDDSRSKQVVPLADPAKGLSIGPFVWHELTDFAPDTVILCLSSGLHDERDYLRNYDEFMRLSAERNAA